MIKKTKVCVQVYKQQYDFVRQMKRKIASFIIDLNFIIKSEKLYTLTNNFEPTNQPASQLWVFLLFGLVFVSRVLGNPVKLLFLIL
jgi:hypothetical protein